MGQHYKALPLYLRGLAISEKAEGPEHGRTGIRLNDLAALYHAMGPYDKALMLYQRALRVTEKAQGAQHTWTWEHLRNLAVCTTPSASSIKRGFIPRSLCRWRWRSHHPN